MSNVQYEGDNLSGSSGFSSPSPSPVNTSYSGLNNFGDNPPVIGGPKMVRWLVKVGIARTEKQALYTLVGICVFCILVAIILIFTAGSSRKATLEKLQRENSVLTGQNF